MRLCSFLMPTRTATHDVLTNAVKSIVLNCPETCDLEILLRVDDDDAARIPFAQELVRGIGKVVVGPRGRGYNEMGTFVQELVNVADSKFCWLFDDDAWVEGDWYSELIKADPATSYVNSQFYCLGESTYPCNGGEACGIIIPTEVARSMGPCLPVDRKWLEHVRSLRLSPFILTGVSYHHDGRARV